MKDNDPSRWSYLHNFNGAATVTAYMLAGEADPSRAAAYEKVIMREADARVRANEDFLSVLAGGVGAGSLARPSLYNMFRAAPEVSTGEVVKSRVLPDYMLADSELLTNRPSGVNEYPVIKDDFKGTDLAQHLSVGGPHGKTIYGAHRQDAFEAALTSIGATEVGSRIRIVDGIYEVKYETSSGAMGKKTIYDPVVYSDQSILNMSNAASRGAWDHYISTGQKVGYTTAGEVPFRILWSISKDGIPTIYAHPGNP